MQLFSLGFLTLFLELVLIRYLAGNVWNLGYFPNLVLIATFIGMGTGFVFHHLVSVRSAPPLFCRSAELLALLVAFAVFVHPEIPGIGEYGGIVGGELYFSSTQARDSSPQGSLFHFGIWFGTIVGVFFLISQWTAKKFRLFKPLTAYSLDIGGSICGILVFMAFSFFEVPATAWFLLLMPLYLLALGPSLTRWRVSLLLVTLSLTAGLVVYQDGRLLYDPGYEGRLDVRWSPYQKTEYASDIGGEEIIFVNGIVHQAIHDEQVLRYSAYQLPYLARAQNDGLEPYRDVLIIGAGNGNDVAVALMNGAERVDAVEIDPVLVDYGRNYHPLQPYADPRVRVIVDDGRAFLTRTGRRYDLILFALTDSLIKVSPVAQLRLENYLFTVESVRRAAQLLAPEGDIVFYNYYRTDWLLNKIRAMAQAATGIPPKTLGVKDDLAYLAVGEHSRGEPVAYPELLLPRDDWPFLYLLGPSIPRIYLVALAILVTLIALLFLALKWQGRARRNESRPTPLGRRLAFLLMGVAFLLLETKSVIQFSLLFGTTWLNSSLVFLAVLTLILAANWTARLLPRGTTLTIYVGLIGSCLVAYFVPLATLLAIESGAVRFLAAAALIFLPIFFANLVFSVSFRDQPVAEHLFGWNLLGATIGGVLEYSSMLVGYNALTLLVAACYSIVILLLLKERVSVGTALPETLQPDGPE